MAQVADPDIFTKTSPTERLPMTTQACRVTFTTIESGPTRGLRLPVERRTMMRFSDRGKDYAAHFVMDGLVIRVASLYACHGRDLLALTPDTAKYHRVWCAALLARSAGERVTVA